MFLTFLLFLLLEVSLGVIYMPITLAVFCYMVHIHYHVPIINSASETKSVTKLFDFLLLLTLLEKGDHCTVQDDFSIKVTSSAPLEGLKTFKCVSGCVHMFEQLENCVK